MKKAVIAITLFDMVFLLVLSIAGSIDGIFGEIAYYFSFIIPLILALLYVKKANEDEIKPSAPRIFPDANSVLYSLPVIAPFIAVVFLISFLTSLLLGALGFSDTTDVSGNILFVIMKHALLPAIFEEAVFRFIPIMLLAPYSKKNALVISSLFFACIHCNLFQIPYALAAGFILSLLALATGSVFPCIIIHFLNNVASILFMRYGQTPYFNLYFFASLGILALVSVLFIIIKRKTYSRVFEELKEDKCNVEFTLSAVLLVAMSLIIGVINLWMQL